MFFFVSYGTYNAPLLNKFQVTLRARIFPTSDACIQLSPLSCQYKFEFFVVKYEESTIQLLLVEINKKTRRPKSYITPISSFEEQ